MAETKKTMDVSKPGTVKPDIGGKPMIVGHKAMVDPTVKEDVEGEGAETEAQTPAEEAPKEAPSAARKVIAPISEAEKPAESEPTKEEKKPDETPAQTGTSEESSKDGDKDKKSDKIDPSAEAMEREEKVNKLIESKKYFVDIKQSNNSGKSRMWLLIVLFILGLGALFYFADTDKIDLGFDLPVDVFGEEDKQPFQSQTPETSQPEKVEESDEVSEEVDLSKITFPETWGKMETTSSPNQFTFDQLDNFVFEVNNEPVGTRMYVAIGMPGECELTAEGTWEPVKGEDAPKTCDFEEKTEGNTKIYVLEIEALGAYSLSEIFEANGSLVRLIQVADPEKDYNVDLVEREIKDGVEERIKNTLEQRTAEFLESN